MMMFMLSKEEEQEGRNIELTTMHKEDRQSGGCVDSKQQDTLKKQNFENVRRWVVIWGAVAC